MAGSKIVDWPGLLPLYSYSPPRIYYADHVGLPYNGTYTLNGVPLYLKDTRYNVPEEVRPAPSILGGKRYLDTDSAATPPPKRQKFDSAVINPHDVITIQSDDDDEPDKNEHTNPWVRAKQVPHKTGILPTDSLQDIIINSIEAKDEKYDADDEDVGARQYRRLLRETPGYSHVQHDFDSYRLTAPANMPQSPSPTAPYAVDMRGPALPPLAEGISRVKAPAQAEKYAQPIYTAKTTNALVPLAIVRIAMKNLPFINFASGLENLPIGFEDAPPRWPTKAEDAEIEFLDDFLPQTAKPMPEAVNVVFCPHFYADKRHAIGFYTNASPTKLRQSTMVFTPCSAGDLDAAKLLCYFGDETEKKMKLELMEFGAGGGRWIQKPVVPVMNTLFDKWSMAVRAVGVEWKRRVQSFQCVRNAEE